MVNRLFTFCGLFLFNIYIIYYLQVTKEYVIQTNKYSSPNHQNPRNRILILNIIFFRLNIIFSA
jgi:hypothetical protein